MADWSPPLCTLLVLALFSLIAWKLRKLLEDRDWREAAFQSAFARDVIGESRFHWKIYSYDVLLVFRCIASIFCVCIWFDVAYRTDFGFYRAYTCWNFTLITLFFLSGTKQSIRAHQGQHDARWHDKVHLISGNILVTTTFIVTTVVWTILYPNLSRINPKEANAKFLSLDSIAQHILNLVLVQFDFFLSTMPIVQENVIFVLLFVITYGIMFVIDWFVDGYAVYPFLSLDHSLASVFLLGLFFLHALLFKLSVWVSTIKMKAVESRAPLAPKSGASYGELDSDNLIENNRNPVNREA